MRIILLAALLVLGAGTAQAEPLTLAQALERAESVSHTLRLQRLSVEQSETEWLEDAGVGSPEIRLQLEELGPGGSGLEPSTRVRLPIPVPWRLALARAESRAEVAREEAQLEDLRADVREAVRVRFYLLPIARDALAAARSRLGHRRALRDLVEARRLEGLSTALEWLEVEEEVRDAADDVAEAASDVERVDAELRTLLDWPDDEALEPAPGDVVARARAVLDGGVVVEPSQALREAEAEERRAALRIRELAARAVPWLEWVQAGVRGRPGQSPEVDLGVSIEVPLEHWGPDRLRAGRSELEVARVRRSQVQAREERSARRRHRAAQAAWSRWEVERDHRQSLLDNAEPMLEVADPVLALELRARLARSELRVQRALASLAAAIEQVPGAGAVTPSDPAP